MHESGASLKWRANVQGIYRVLAYRNLRVAALKQDKYIVQHQRYKEESGTLPNEQRSSTREISRNMKMYRKHSESYTG